jgi:cobalt/nickel transport system ATP-binding protein
MTASPNLIDIKGLAHKYADGTPSLRGLDLQIATGESVAILGPNGAGKSSLFLCLAGLVSFEASMFQVGEIDGLRKENRRLLASRAALLFQDSDDQLFCPTVLEDVAFGPRNHGASIEAANQSALEALKFTGMLEKKDRPPHQLSGGEKRRVALAGLLAMNPDILLLDEPSQFLDHRNRRNLINLLKQNSHTKLIATHDLEMALEICSRAVLISEGTVVGKGPIHELLGNQSLLASLGMEQPHSLAPRS